MPNQQIQDLERCRLIINKIKDHRHDKIKRRQIDKFDCLFFKCHGYHHSLSRQTQNLDNIDTQSTLSRHWNVPSSFTNSSTQPSSNPVVPATSIAPTPSISTDPASNIAPGLPTNYRGTCTNNDKWVINISRPPHCRTFVTSTKRIQFCHYPQVPPIEAYITVVEQASSKLPSQEGNEFRSDVNKLLKQPQTQCNNQCNLNPIQMQSLHTTQGRQFYGGTYSRQGVAMIINDKEDYTNKAQTLLQDTNTYKVLKKDLTSQLKNELINLLKDIKQAGGLSTNKYKQLYPTSAVPPKFYGLPKIHKVGTPLRPIVSSRGSITYGVVKELAYIIKPFVDQSPTPQKDSTLCTTT